MLEGAPHLTTLELAWNNLPVGSRVALQRQDAYDFGVALFHSPNMYNYIKLPQEVCVLTLEELSTRLSSLVHPGVSDMDMPIRCPRMGSSTQRNTISEEVLRQLLRNAESQLVFGGAIDELVTAYRDDRALQILGLLSHPLLGNRRNRGSLSHESVADLVSICLRDRLPFQLVLPAFPFKDQNPFRTLGPASHWDIGEAALIIRLHCLALGLNQLHPYDGECLIVSDGRAYAQIFGIHDSEATEYLQSLRELRNSLNMQRTIHIIDLRLVMDRVDRSFALEIDGDRIVGLRNSIAYIEDRLEALGRSDAFIAAKLTELANSMVWNMETRDYVPRVGYSLLWRAMNIKCSRLDGRTHELRTELRSRSWRVALKYAAFSITLSATKFWERIFPSSIRATVHAKAGQAVIPKLGRGDPWNAVGVIDDALLGPDAIRTLPLWKVSSKEYEPVYLAGSPIPVAIVRRELVPILVNK